MNDNDLLARLADALRLNGDTCTRANAEHLADVLLSLPGIAIVELPEPDGYATVATTFSSGTVTAWHNTKGERSITNHAATLMFPDSARKLAAALLAAANAAERSDA